MHCKKHIINKITGLQTLY